jgi:sortase A
VIGSRARVVALAAGAAALAAGILLFVEPSFSTGEALPAPAPANEGVTAATPAVNTGSAANQSPDRPVNGVAFEMTIPSLGYRATVHEGVDAGVLERGPGHYPTTAWPGHAGTVGIAAHNVYWIDFSRLTNGDVVEVRTRRALVVYEITSSRVTDPNDRTVLASSSAHKVALTTCYPLWAGAFATRRLIFMGREVGSYPIASPPAPHATPRRAPGA